MSTPVLTTLPPRPAANDDGPWATAPEMEIAA
jgi:hypothetical protein